MVMPLGNEAKPRIIPWATYLLVLGNLVGYGLEMTRPLSFAIAFAVTPYEITHGVDICQPFVHHIEPVPSSSSRSDANQNSTFIHQASGPWPIQLTLVTALFLHADLIHLAGNMLFLMIFGQRIEEAFGRLTFLSFYLACGVVGTLTQVMVAPESLKPSIGASAAIAGVMGAYLIWFPRDRVRVLLINVIYLIPASVVIGCWIGIQVIQEYLMSRVVIQAGDIAYLAHLAGAAVGVVTSIVLRLILDSERRRSV